MKKLLFVFLFSMAATAFGRAPAVEPIRGISIDEYKEVDPKADPGFNWNRDHTVVDTSLITTREPAQKALIDSTKSQKKSWPTYAFLASLIALPFFLWYSVMKGLENGNATGHVETGSQPEVYPHHDNTVDLMTERNKREEKTKKDGHIPKAS